MNTVSEQEEGWPALAERLSRELGTPVTRLERVQRAGYTKARLARAELGDGRRAFLKASTDEMTRQWLQAEHRAYRHLRGGFMPRMLAFLQEPERDVLVLEDLSDASWPPPWTQERVTLVLHALDEIAALPPPPGTPPMREIWRELTAWTKVEREPETFLSLGLCTPRWLATALPVLQAASVSAKIDGEALLHCDVRSDNLCFQAGRAVFVDWNWMAVGNPLVAKAAWLPSLHAEGGPAPEEILPQGGEYAAVMSGYWALNAGLPPPPGAPHLRQLQRNLLRVTLAWAARALGLPPPEPPRG
jgi:hypothetical protein